MKRKCQRVSIADRGRLTVETEQIAVGHGRIVASLPQSFFFGGQTGSGRVGQRRRPVEIDCGVTLGGENSCAGRLSGNGRADGRRDSVLRRFSEGGHRSLR